jgi:hypothetical protein
MNHTLKYLLIALVFPLAVAGQRVEMEGGRFTMNNSPWFPLACNFGVEIVEDNSGHRWVCANSYYGSTEAYESTPAASYNEMVDLFEDVIDLGFNSVRVFGLTFGRSSTISTPHYAVQNINNGWQPNPATYALQSPYTDLFGFIQTVLDAADDASANKQKPLKVQLLTGGKGIDGSFSTTYFEPYLSALSAHFASNTTLYSYDLVNEPNLDNLMVSGSKNDVCNVTKAWDNALGNCPQLTTIGSVLYDIRTWDPAFFNVDFHAFHLYAEGIPTYQAKLDEVKTRIKWISSVSHIPWTLGEIGFNATGYTPVGPVDGTTSEQADFAEKTMNYLRDCGGVGYSWWEFEDHQGGSYVGVREVDGANKLIAAKFQNFNPFAYTSNNAAPSNYYNPFNASGFKITGTVIENSKPAHTKCNYLCLESSTFLYIHKKRWNV